MTPEELRARLENEKPMSYSRGGLNDFIAWLPFSGTGPGDDGSKMQYTYQAALALPDEELMKYWLEFCLNGKERNNENYP